MQKNLLRIFIFSAVIVAATMLLAFVITRGGGPAAEGEIQPAAGGDTPVTAGETQPALALKNLQDEVVDLQALQGNKVLLVNYWATWCPPCITEIPSLLQVRDERRSDKFDVVFINLDFPKDLATLKTMMKRIGFENLDTLYMYDARQWSELNGRGLPISVLVAPDGRILKRFVGGLDWVSAAGDEFLKDVPKNRP